MQHATTVNLKKLKVLKFASLRTTEILCKRMNVGKIRKGLEPRDLVKFTVERAFGGVTINMPLLKDGNIYIDRTTKTAWVQWRGRTFSHSYEVACTYLNDLNSIEDAFKGKLLFNYYDDFSLVEYHAGRYRVKNALKSWKSYKNNLAKFNEKLVAKGKSPLVSSTYSSRLWYVI